MWKLKTRKGKLPAGDPVMLLADLLATYDFNQLKDAIRTLGESGEGAAVKPLIEVAKEAAALRSVVLAALRKLANDSDEAAVELSCVTLEEKPEESIGGEWGVRVFSAQDRRHSPRVLLEVPVLVNWTDKTGLRRTDLTTTKVVNADGALIAMKAPVPVSSILELINVKTKAVATAKVVLSGEPNEKGGFDVAVELETSDSSFWVGRNPT